MKKALNLLFVVFLVLGIAFLDGCKKKADPPTVTTTQVSEITVNSAMSGGNVTADGGAEVTARGVCWATTTKPTITSSKTSDSKGTGAFTSSITGLSENTTYYVRAYATNSEGTAYGNELTFTTSQVVGATVTTTAASAVASTTATAGGNVTADGGGSITSRGVCWSTTADPTTNDSKTSDGTGTGVFTSSITGLTPGTEYHIRAYATNSSGTAYGADMTFTTLAVVPTLTTTTPANFTTTSASSGGNITSDGGSAVTARGVCWSTTTGPVATGSHTSDGTGPGTFTSSITGLTANTTYYVRAYATNSIGTAYGDEKTFSTTAASLATVTTTAADPVASTTAVAGGNVTADGGAAVTARGVCWATTANPTNTGSKTTDGAGTGVFVSNISGLLPGTTYHLRAYAVNTVGVAYGEDLTFTTSAVMPTVTTVPDVTAITGNSATSGGNVTATGGADVTARGVCWSTTADPTIADSHTTDGTGAGSFVSSLTGLSPATTYYVKAYATNSAGTAYGAEVSFRTANETGTLQDADGNTYKTVKLGNQWWMAENLKTTKYNDNSSITNVTGNSAWMALTTEAYCWYENDQAANKNEYGAMYNWYAINTGKLCPSGWHVPTDNEFKTLEMFFGMTQAQADAAYWRGTNEGTQMKTTTGWTLNGNGTDTQGFSVKPAGYRFYVDGAFYDAGSSGSFGTSTEWSSTTYIYRQFRNDHATVFRGDVGKAAGFSVRCVQD